MTTFAKIIADSISETGERLTTVQVKFHRYILSEVNTHRVFSRNYSSSRAIPISKLIEQVRKDPATPVYWGKNKAGMQAEQELSGDDLELTKAAWINAANSAADNAEHLMNLGLHKQTANRILEPFLWTHGIITSSEWNNFFLQRCHPDAQPEIQLLANEIRKALNNSTPVILKEGEWHLPYIREKDYELFSTKNNELQAISAARCARVSYLKHDGSEPSPEDDLNLYNRLVGGDVCHYSPLEHQATPDVKIDEQWKNKHLHGNLIGWIQYRKIHEGFRAASKVSFS